VSTDHVTKSLWEDFSYIKYTAMPRTGSAKYRKLPTKKQTTIVNKSN